MVLPGMIAGTAHPGLGCKEERSWFIKNALNNA
jgi:hypothetical protein